jgi:CHAT domain-containing protein/tetratricopeptide (TPR) repeat protein
MSPRVPLLLALLLTGLASSTAARDVVIDAQPGFSLTRSLQGGELHQYEFALDAERFARLTFEQRGVDVVVTVFAPDGQQLTEVDRPNTAYGREAVSVVTRTAGIYRVQVRSLVKTALPGSYRLTVTDMRRAMALDASRARAEQAVTEGESLRASNTAATCRHAVEKFSEALTVWRVLGDRYEQMWALYGLGLSHRFLGEQQAAITALSEALQISRVLHDLHGQALAQTALAWAYLYLGETDRAGRNFVATLSLRRKLGDRLGEALTEAGIAWTSALLFKHDVALQHFRAALALRHALADRRGEALTAIGLGRVLVAKGLYRDAIEELTAAAATLRADTSNGYGSYGYAEALSELGWTYLAIKDPDAAIDKFTEALPLRRQAGDRTGEATTLFGIARAERLRGRLNEARTSIETALDGIETLRSQGDNLQLRMSYFASVQAYYTFAIDVLMDLHARDATAGYDIRAYDLHQRGRARGLLDLLQESIVDIRSDVARDLLDEERKARQDVNAAAERQQLLLSRRATDEARRQVAQDVADAVARHDSTEQRLRSSSPRYRALAEPRPLRALEVQRDLLDRETLLLDYAVGAERSFVWAITRDNVTAYELSPRERIETAARRFREAITARTVQPKGETPLQWQARIVDADRRADTAARIVGDILLAPVLHGTTVRRLAVVPHGILQLIPFGSLRIPAGHPARSAQRIPLIARYEVVHLPSASALAWLRNGAASRSPASKAVAIFADPIFDIGDERLARIRLDSKHRAEETNVRVAAVEGPTASRAARLFASRWEAEHIAALVPSNQSRVLLDSAASRSAALDPDLGHYGAVHFATHAFVNDQRPGLGGILLSTIDARGSAVPGLLSLQDVFTMRLGSDLVVLGGCRTGLGQMVEGEGLRGLASGFFHAGVPRVVAGLWPVDDVATAQLMVHFYRAMFGPSHLSPSAALRTAQLEMQKNLRWQSPYYWAGFTLQGEWK